MKKIIMAAILFAANIVFISCSNDIEQEFRPVGKGESGLWTVLIPATKGNSNMRGLSLSGSTLNASWKTTEHVYVKNKTRGNTIDANTLSPDANASSANLVGTLDGEYAAGDNLELMFPSSTVSYAGQVGTLEDIAAKYDYAKASMTVNSASAGVLTFTSASANFVNQQAICKFTFEDYGGNPLNPTSVVISASNLVGGPLTITPDGSTNEIYVAMSNTNQSNKETYSFVATVGGVQYQGWKKAKIENGNYYSTTVTLASVIDLSTLTANRTIDIDAVLINTTSYSVSVAANKKISLYNATINNTLYFNQDNTLNVEGTNSVSGILAGDWAGTLTIKGDGTLTSQGSEYFPGICMGSTTGTILIKSGTLTFRGGYGAAGIGSAASGHPYSQCGNIVIEGGTVTAIGGADACGIGSGTSSIKSSNSNNHKTVCGNITIKGGYVTATGGTNAAGIGSGEGYRPTSGDGDAASCGNIAISGGTVIANGGSEAAGIGAGYASSDHSKCGNITISGGTVTATGGENGAGIGGGHGYRDATSSCKVITISGGTVTAIGGNNGAGIGTAKGNLSSYKYGKQTRYYAGYTTCDGITIKGGTIIARSGNNASCIGVGQGVEGRTDLSSYCSCGTITFQNGITSLTIDKGTTTGSYFISSTKGTEAYSTHATTLTGTCGMTLTTDTGTQKVFDR